MVDAIRKTNGITPDWSYRFQRHGKLPRPKNSPPDCFLNALSIPAREKHNEKELLQKQELFFMVNYGARNTNTMP